MINKTCHNIEYFKKIESKHIKSYFCSTKNHYEMNIGNKIKLFRTNKGISQKEIALSIGIDQAQYSRIENGKVEPTLSSLEKIADALEIKIAELFSEKQPTTIDSYNKSMVERLQLLDELEENEKNAIYSIIDMAVSKSRLKNTLKDALNSDK